MLTNFTRVLQPIPSWLNGPITFNGRHHRLTNTIHLTLKKTSTQVVNMSVTNNLQFFSELQNYSHPDNHTIKTNHVIILKSQLAGDNSEK